jgi:predicted house-cleaning noncanonical NTP pyrophosphatase (MazG superfamily)
MPGKVYYNKLVRDNIPDVIRAKGSQCEVRTLEPAEYERELLKKVEEEATAFPGLTSKEDLTKELADLVDVLHEVKKVFGITDDEVQAAQEAALAKKGGFEKRVFLVWSSDDGYKTNEKRNS